MFVEETSKSKTAEESEKKASVMHDKLGLKHVKVEDIEIAHRVGEKKEGKTRPITVKFVSRKTKNDAEGC